MRVAHIQAGSQSIGATQGVIFTTENINPRLNVKFMEVLCVLKNTDTANAQDTAIRVEILDTNNNPLIQWTERDYLSTYNTVRREGILLDALRRSTTP